MQTTRLDWSCRPRVLCLEMLASSLLVFARPAGQHADLPRPLCGGTSDADLLAGCTGVTFFPLLIRNLLVLLLFQDAATELLGSGSRGYMTTDAWQNKTQWKKAKGIDSLMSL
jgi:hypothetical protein